MSWCFWILSSLNHLPHTVHWTRPSPGSGAGVNFLCWDEGLPRDLTWVWALRRGLVVGFDEVDFLVRFLAADLGIGLVCRVAFMGLFLDVCGFLAGLLADTIFFYFFFSEVNCS